MSERDYEKDPRFQQIPGRFDDTKTRYHIDSQLVQAIVQKREPPFFFQDIDLSTARDKTNYLEINQPGRGFVIFGYTTATGPTGTGLYTVSPSAICDIRLDSNEDTRSWIAKHNRGYRGDFSRLIIQNPAQADISCRIYIFKFDESPFMSGEAAT